MIVTYEMLKSNLNPYQGRIISYGSEKKMRFNEKDLKKMLQWKSEKKRGMTFENNEAGDHV